MVAVVPPVMPAGAESQQRGAAAEAAAIYDKEEACDGVCATLPQCHPATLPPSSQYDTQSVWAQSGHWPREQDRGSGALATGSTFFLLMYGRRHTQGALGLSAANFLIIVGRLM